MTKFQALFISRGDIVTYRGALATVTDTGSSGTHGLDVKLDGQSEWVSYQDIDVARQDGCEHTVPCSSRAVCNDINYVSDARE